VIHRYGQRVARYARPDAPISASLTHYRRENGNVPEKRLVLYVNADDNSRILVTRLARRWHQVEMVFTDDAQTGMRTALARRPDLIMMDVELPDMDGSGLLVRLRALPATALTPIVVLSTDDTPEHRRSLLEAGASACLARPVNIADVQRYVGTLLGVGPLTPAAWV